MPRGQKVKGRRFHLTRETSRKQVWRAKSATVWVNGRRHTLVVAVCESTGEVKYFLTNATAASLRRILRVAFRRWTVEHLFRVAKTEVGLMHYEGPRTPWCGLILCLVVLRASSRPHRPAAEKIRIAVMGWSRSPGVEPAVRALFRRRRETGDVAPHRDVIRYRIE